MDQSALNDTVAGTNTDNATEQIMEEDEVDKNDSGKWQFGYNENTSQGDTDQKPVKNSVRMSMAFGDEETEKEDERKQVARDTMLRSMITNGVKFAEQSKGSDDEDNTFGSKRSMKDMTPA